jgi:hypothetical protein
MNSSELTLGIGVVGGLSLKRYGVIAMQGAGSPTDGTSGTGAAKIGVWGQYYDRTNNVVWTNVGTKASPVWSMMDAAARFAITAANILAMNGAPVALLGAPGSGRLIQLYSVCFNMIPTATQFASGGVVTFVYTGTATAAHTGSIAAAVVNSASASITLLGALAAAGGTTVTADTNLGISITNATGAFTTGTGTAVVWINYAILPTA